MSKYDLLIGMPRTTQGWVNWASRRAPRGASSWAIPWQREFLPSMILVISCICQRCCRSADDAAAVGAWSAGGWQGAVVARVRAAAAAEEAPAARARGRQGKGKGMAVCSASGDYRTVVVVVSCFMALRIGEMPPELHMRVGSVPDGARSSCPPFVAGDATFKGPRLAWVVYTEPRHHVSDGRERRQSATNAAIERARRRHARRRRG